MKWEVLVRIAICITLSMLLCGWGVNAQNPARDYVYFLAANSGFKSAVVIPIPKARNSDIILARQLISGEIRDDSNYSRASIRVIPGGDGINRNHLNIGAPPWSWRVEFLEYVGRGAPPEWRTFAEVIEHDPELASQRERTYLDGYRFVGEMKFPTLSARIEPNPPKLDMRWDDLGEYEYTVQLCDGANGDWIPVAGVDWPILTNYWSVPNPSSGSAIYRVRADLLLE